MFVSWKAKTGFRKEREKERKDCISKRSLSVEAISGKTRTKLSTGFSVKLFGCVL